MNAGRNQVTQPSNLSEIVETVQVFSHIDEACRYCSDMPRRRGPVFDTSIDDKINHYIREHNFRLLYIGPETDLSDDSADRNERAAVTTAILGSTCEMT